MVPSFWCFFRSVAPKAVVPKFYYPETPQLSRSPMAVSPICSQEKTRAQLGGKDCTGWVLAREVGSGQRGGVWPVVSSGLEQGVVLSFTVTLYSTGGCVHPREQGLSKQICYLV